MSYEGVRSGSTQIVSPSGAMIVHGDLIVASRNSKNTPRAK